MSPRAPTEPPRSKERPSAEGWLDEIKNGPAGPRVGMYLVHNGVVRSTSRTGAPVTEMHVSCDYDLLAKAIRQVETRPGVFAVRVWINEGALAVGDDIMLALVAGDIRDNVFAGMQELVRLIKSVVITEREVG